MYIIVSFVSILTLNLVQSSRIMVVVPTPSISHQVLFYPLITELVNRRHEVVFVTTDAMYPEGNRPPNLMEIDTHEKSYKQWRDQVLTQTVTSGNKGDLFKQFRTVVPSLDDSFEIQVQELKFQELMKNKTQFDLLIIEACTRSALAVSHVFKAPVILMSSLGPHFGNMELLGAPTYPKLLYPYYIYQKVNNLTLIDKLKVLYDVYSYEKFFSKLEHEQNKMIKRLFGPDTPSLKELDRNVQMLFINNYPSFDNNRPVPSSVQYIGGIHQKQPNDLPKELKSYLDSSRNGVVYFSLGTNVSPSTLGHEKIKIIVGALSKLNYDVLVKWDHEDLPGKTDNIRVARWLPQVDLLRHPNIKVFITQGGLQSFDETLTAGVPVVGIPMFGDQWYNVEQYVRLGMGVGLLMEELTEDKLVNAINTVIDDPRYRQNVISLRSKLRDQPQSALDRAVWWTEHILKHGGSHLQAPAANMTWTEYLDLELITVLLLAAMSIAVASAAVLYWIMRTVRVFISGYKVKAE